MQRIGWIFGLLVICCLNRCSVYAQYWERTYGAYGNDRIGGLVPTVDGGAIVVGSTGSFGQGGGDIYLFRIDDSGSLLWSKTFGGIGVEEGVSIAGNSNGQYVLASNIGNGPFGGYDVQLTMVDGNGDLQWQRSYGDQDWQFCNKVASTPSGWVFVGRDFSSTSNGSSWIVAIDALGDTLWTHTMGSAGGSEAKAVVSTATGEVLAVGERTISNTDKDGFVVSLSASGAVNWTTFIGGDSLEAVNGVSLSATGEILCAGESNSAGVEQQILVARLDQTGAVLAENSIGFNQNIWGYDVAESWSGGIMCLGRTSSIGGSVSDYYLLFTDIDGNFELGRTYGGAGDDIGLDLAVNGDGSLYLAGNTDSYGPGVEAIMLIRSDSTGVSSGVVVEGFDPLSVPAEETFDERFFLRPTIAQEGDELILSEMPNEQWLLQVVDINGRVVWSEERQGVKCSIRVPAIEAGSYMLVVTGGKLTKVRSFMVH